jgi:hypothetical protein
LRADRKHICRTRLQGTNPATARELPEQGRCRSHLEQSIADAIFQRAKWIGILRELKWSPIMTTIVSLEMQIAIRLLLCFVSSAAFAATVCAQERIASPNENIDWPSPDGKFAFLTSYGEDQRTIALIDKKSGKKLQIGEEDSSQTSWHPLWAPDSNRFALMTRLGHPIQTVDVYFRSSETFRKIKLPDLPEANIPEKLRQGKKFPHVASLNWQEAREWKKDGSLVVTINTMIDGAGSSILATRTVVLGFDRTGKATIMKSTIKIQGRDGLRGRTALTWKPWRHPIHSVEQDRGSEREDARHSH